MFNLDPAKLLIIAIVVVVLVGPDKLPQVARQIGRGWRTLNEYRHKMESDVRESIPDLPSSHEIATLARSPTALLHRLAALNDHDESTAEAGADGVVDGATVGTDSVNGSGSGSGFGTGVTNGSAPANGSGPGVAPGGTAGPDHDVAVFGDPSLN